MTSILSDIKLSFRSLFQNPVFTIIFVVTLALSMGGTALIFSLVDAILFRSLPYPNADELVTIHCDDIHGRTSDFLSADTFFLLKENAKSFESMAAMIGASSGANVSGGASPVFVKSLAVSADYFPTLKVAPMIGRGFLKVEDTPGGPGAVVISHSLWVNHFSSSNSLLGKPILIGGQSYKVVGIMPASFHSFPAADVWLPLQLNSSRSAANNYLILGRIKTGATFTQAAGELSILSSQISENLQNPYGPKKVLQPEYYKKYLVGDSNRGLLALFSAVCLALLIACANLMALFMSRAATRQREMMIRSALGAASSRLVRLVLIDSTVLSLAGAISGLFLAYRMLPLLVRLAPESLPRTQNVNIDLRVILFALVTASITSVVFGGIPAWRAKKINVQAALKEGHVHFSPRVGYFRIFHLLVSVETALAVILLAGSGLLMGSFLRLRSVPTGFISDHLFVSQVSLAGQRYQTSASAAQFANAVIDRLQATQSIGAVGAISGLPFENGLNIPMYPAGRKQDGVSAGQYRQITPDYFKVMGISIKGGRSFQESDTPQSPSVAIINESMAHRFWPQHTALGEHIIVGEGIGAGLADKPREVVGIVGDVREAGLDKPASPTIFVPIAQQPDAYAAMTNQFFFMSFLLKSSTNDNIGRTVQSAISDVQPDLPVAIVHPISEVVDGWIAEPRLYAWLVSAFAGFSLLLIVTGLYGLLSYQISLQTRDIGIRMAIGAQRSHVMTMVLREYMMLVAIGVIAGIAGAIGLARLISSMLYNIHPNDPATYISILVLIFGVTSIAVWIPAYSVTSINLTSALRRD